MEGSDVFISYIAEDGEIARQLKRELNVLGYSAWIFEEDGVGAGASYVRGISQAIKDCRVFALVASKPTAESFEVEKEVESAYKQQKPFLAVRVHQTHEEFIQSKELFGHFVGTGVTVSADERSLSEVARQIQSTLVALGAPRPGPLAGSSQRRRPLPRLLVVGLIVQVVWGVIVTILTVPDITAFVRGFLVGVLCVVAELAAGLFIMQQILQSRRSGWFAERRLHLLRYVLVASAATCVVGFADAYLPESVYGSQAPVVVFGMSLLGIGLTWFGLRMLEATPRKTNDY